MTSGAPRRASRCFRVCLSSCRVSACSQRPSSTEPGGGHGRTDGLTQAQGRTPSLAGGRRGEGRGQDERGAGDQRNAVLGRSACNRKRSPLGGWRVLPFVRQLPPSLSASRSRFPCVRRLMVLLVPPLVLLPAMRLAAPRMAGVVGEVARQGRRARRQSHPHARTDPPRRTARDCTKGAGSRLGKSGRRDSMGAQAGRVSQAP